MAPLADQTVGLAPREDGCGAGRYLGYDGRCYTYSTWYWWGRWVFAGLALLFILIVFAMLFRNSRRRRKQGQQPLYGTGWMAPGPAPAYYASGPPPPQYTPQGDPNVYNQPGPGHKYNQHDGYYGNQQSYPPQQSSSYGGQQEGIELQQPQSAYHRGTDGDYAPPPGPPPNAANKP